jgi:hypothetical protein
MPAATEGFNLPMVSAFGGGFALVLLSLPTDAKLALIRSRLQEALLKQVFAGGGAKHLEPRRIFDETIARTR